MRDAIIDTQWLSVASRGNQRQADAAPTGAEPLHRLLAIRGHQRPSEAIRGNQGPPAPSRCIVCLRSASRSNSISSSELESPRSPPRGTSFFSSLRRLTLHLMRDAIRHNQTQSETASSSSRRRCTCSAVGALRLSASGTAGGRTKASSDSRSCCNCDEGRNQTQSVSVSRGRQWYSVAVSGGSQWGQSVVIRRAHLELLLLGRRDRTAARAHDGARAAAAAAPAAAAARAIAIAMLDVGCR